MLLEMQEEARVYQKRRGDRREFRLIDWRFQIFLSGLLMGSVLLTSLMLMLTYSVVFGVYRQAELDDASKAFFSHAALITVLLLLFALLSGLILSHRMVGPIIALKNALRQKHPEGKLDLKTRSDDFFQNLIARRDS